MTSSSIHQQIDKTMYGRDQAVNHLLWSSSSTVGGPEWIRRVGFRALFIISPPFTPPYYSSSLPLRRPLTSSWRRQWSVSTLGKTVPFQWWQTPRRWYDVSSAVPHCGHVAISPTPIRWRCLVRPQRPVKTPIKVLRAQQLLDINHLDVGRCALINYLACLHPFLFLHNSVVPLRAQSLKAFVPFYYLDTLCGVR